MRNLLTISIEGLGTGLVGAYGSNTAFTPNLDRLAARGIVLDQCFLDSQQLTEQLTSLWTARHALQVPQPGFALWQRLRQAGIPAKFYTDNPVAAQWAEHCGCGAVTLVQPPRPIQAVEEGDESAVVVLFAAVAEELSGDAEGLVWVHSSGLRLPWDAPLRLRQQFTDPEDPEPPSNVEPPSFAVDDTVDPDLVIGWGQVAAAQVALIDDALGNLQAALALRGQADDWSTLCIGLGGVPLGEHGRVGWGTPQLHGEELQCTAIWRPSPAAPIGWRRAELCQLPDLAATIFEGCDMPDETSPFTNDATLEDTHPTDDATSGHHAAARPLWGRSLLECHPSDTPSRWPRAHQLALLKSELGIWLRSPAWSAWWPPSTADCPEPTPRLYVKPDDRWEVTEVADRCPEIVEQLRRQADAFLHALEAEDRDLLPELAVEQTNLMR